MGFILTGRLMGSYAAPPDSSVNFAVNNDGHYFPRVSASPQCPNSSVSKLIDGNYWYHVSPPNRWTCEGSPNKADWCIVDFGMKRTVQTVKLYVLDDGDKITPPAKIDLEYWDGKAWVAVPEQVRTPTQPSGRRANVITFPQMDIQKLRAILAHSDGSKSGLTEFEVWGPHPIDDREWKPIPVEPARPPPGNMAFNPGGKPFPKAAASFTSRFDKVEAANDGRVWFLPGPTNRWTTYGSPNASDWLEIDFGAEKEFAPSRAGHLRRPRRGAKVTASYDVQFWDVGMAVGGRAEEVPEQPAGGQFNEITFDPVTASKVHVVFTHKGKARSGVSEMFVWEE